jgi:hypothetical protein
VANAMKLAFHVGGHGRCNAKAGHAMPQPMKAPARLVDGPSSYMPPGAASG